MPGDWNFTDVWGLDPEVLAFVQGPVKAVLLLYPISEKVTVKFNPNVFPSITNAQ